MKLKYGFCAILTSVHLMAACQQLNMACIFLSMYFWNTIFLFGNLKPNVFKMERAAKSHRIILLRAAFQIDISAKFENSHFQRIINAPKRFIKRDVTGALQFSSMPASISGLHFHIFSMINTIFVLAGFAYLHFNHKTISLPHRQWSRHAAYE